MHLQSALVMETSRQGLTLTFNGWKSMKLYLYDLEFEVSSMSDNGTAFIAKEFKDFIEANGVGLLRKLIAPYHPASNGQAERYVQRVEITLQVKTEKLGYLHTHLCRFYYRIGKL